MALVSDAKYTERNVRVQGGGCACPSADYPEARATAITSTRSSIERDVAGTYTVQRAV